MIAGRHVPESRDPSSSGRLDVPGAVLGAAALAAITYGLTAQEWLICAVGCGGRRRLRPLRAARPVADGADAHLPVGPVQRHQRGDVPAVRRVRRGPVPPRTRAPGPARLLAAARRRGHRAADDHDAAVLGASRGARPAHRAADPDDRRAAAVRRRVRPADARRAGAQLRRGRAARHPRVRRRPDVDSGAADDDGVELGDVAPRRDRVGRQQRRGPHGQPRRRRGDPGRRRVHRRRGSRRRHAARRLRQRAVGERRCRRGGGDRVGGVDPSDRARRPSRRSTAPPPARRCPLTAD